MLNPRILVAAAAALSLGLGTGALAHHRPDHQLPEQAQGGNGNGGNDDGRGPMEQVEICHITGNGTYLPLTVNGNALDAHLGHGDALPGATVGDVVLGADCSVPTTEPSRDELTLEFGPGGWGGVSCPAGTSVVGGGYEPASADVLVSEAALPGSSYPHYTFGPTESGWVVQAGNTAQTITVFALCEATAG